jgi:hypothetical protein
MRQRIFLLLFFVLVIAALVGLNAVSYTKKDQIPDSEYFPNRSSYNVGATGSSAFYSLLTETGNKVTRWQQPVSALLAPANNKIMTLVLIGGVRREVTEEDAKSILAWVNRGGRLVLIDRDPPSELLTSGTNWKISALGSNHLFESAEPPDPTLLIDKVIAAKPVQPTALMRGINAVQPSTLASQILIKYEELPPAEIKSAPAPLAPLATPKPILKTPSPVPSPSLTPPYNKAVIKKTDESNQANKVPSLVKVGTASPNSQFKIGESDTAAPAENDKADDLPKAPVVHLSNPEKDILVDLPYGNGRILFLSDPYIISNAGIKLVDNSTLGINLVGGGGTGTIAFDEFHQGYGSENTLWRYFAGTPVLAIVAQGFLLVVILLWTRGRRFGRPLPLPAKDRRSKLEYVSAMADLQQSSRSYDLAIENIYAQTKRNMVRLIGADNTIPRKQLAEAISERSGFEAKDLYKLMSKCEDIIAGEPTNAKETINLISQLRALEEKLGFKRTKTSLMK